MKKAFSFIFFPLVISSICHAQILISTVAGTGTFGFSGDGGTATAAKIWLPAGVVVDKNDNLYCTDYGGYRVRKVTPSGIISTAAGNAAGVGGDGGPATAAHFYDPLKLAIDKNGNIYVADDFGHAVRKIDTFGIISTFAGNNIQGLAGDGGPATAAMLSYPSGVACDTAGNVFISDKGNSCIRKVSPAGVITTYAGNHIQGYSGDNGPATAAQLNNPEGIFYSGNMLYIADGGNNRIRAVNTNVDHMVLVAGNGTAGYSCDGCYAPYAALNGPKGITSDGRYLYVADYGNGRIRRIDTTGEIRTIAGNGIQGYGGDGGPALSAMLNNPRDVSIDSHGDLYIADMANHRIRKVWLSAGGVDDKYVMGKENISVFPNPAENSFKVKMPNSDHLTTITILNMSGKVIETRTIKPNAPISEQFYFDDLPLGYYVVRAENTTTLSRVVVHQ